MDSSDQLITEEKGTHTYEEIQGEVKQSQWKLTVNVDNDGDRKLREIPWARVVVL